MPHPIWRILDEEGRRLEWLARQTEYSQEYISRLKNGRVPITAPFRARCALVMGRPESELFDLTEPTGLDDSVSESPSARALTNSDEVPTRR